MTSRKRRLQLRKQRRAQAERDHRAVALLRLRRELYEAMGYPEPTGRSIARRLWKRNRHPSPLVPQYKYPLHQTTTP